MKPRRAKAGDPGPVAERTGLFEPGQESQQLKKRAQGIRRALEDLFSWKSRVDKREFCPGRAAGAPAG